MQRAGRRMRRKKPRSRSSSAVRHKANCGSSGTLTAIRVPTEILRFPQSMVGEAVQGLISQLGALPHMGALFRSVPKAEIDEITRWLNVAIEWAENSKRAINSIQGFINDDSDYSVK